MSSLFIYFIKLYQKFISPLFGSSCRFNPTCSNYAIIAFKTHSFFYAFYLASKRILKCHPFGPHGDDFVPK
ncbi:membrane protein insertion efficiency factor YidD [Gammaproteobacteria bacterium]|jgi:putative membrane protein insertion efficiency factor|nr:membrane protein insertion efficiency factor YidD [Gammaproteobacteria bacterium]MDC1073933.1 membrane protein insertion efficiency factor YidD [Gammaproteobacteria bacterium]